MVTPPAPAKLPGVVGTGGSAKEPLIAQVLVMEHGLMCCRGVKGEPGGVRGSQSGGNAREIACQYGLQEAVLA